MFPIDLVQLVPGESTILASRTAANYFPPNQFAQYFFFFEQRKKFLGKAEVGGDMSQYRGWFL